MKPRISKKIGVTISLAVILMLFSVSAVYGNTGMTASPIINMTVGYGVTATLSLLLVIGYCTFIHKKDTWLLLLFVSVFIVNAGYFALSISKTLSEALLANRFSYLGSVFLPLCMLMNIMNTCKVKLRKWVLALLLITSVLVFILAASPGYLTLYYKETNLVFINGMAKLDKVYGPLHFVYALYLAVYFAIMLGTIATSIVKRHVVSHKHSAILLIIVFLNLSIWLIEQLVYSSYEFLSVSYIISELLLLMLYGMIQDYKSNPELISDSSTIVSSLQNADIQTENDSAKTTVAEDVAHSEITFTDARINSVLENWSVLSILTPREKDVFVALLKNKKRKDIATELNVTEHTIKKHTANIYSKLYVTNRAELFAKVNEETTDI